MHTYFAKKRECLSYRILSGILLIFFATSVVTPPGAVFAQTVIQHLPNLPIPGSMVPVSAGYVPTIIKGLTIHPENPLAFDFIMDTGNSGLTEIDLEPEATKLIKYFLAALTIPEDELWVNLSPYEKDRIVPEELGLTEMGRDMLAQDYILKQLTASMMYPEDNLGREFWDRVYTKAQALYGTTDIPMNTFNKIWILPEKAVIFEKDSSAYVVESRLKVMLEEDYVALAENMGIEKFGTDLLQKSDVEVISGVTSEVVREILIPEIEREINEGKNFATLRQIYNSLILATWFKQNLKESLLGQIYVDKKKINGVDVEDKQIKEKIYDQYIEAFRKGVYDFIKEEYDPNMQMIIPRKYFSGGVIWSIAKTIERVVDEAMVDDEDFTPRGSAYDVEIRLAETSEEQGIIVDAIEASDEEYNDQLFEQYPQDGNLTVDNARHGRGESFIVDLALQSRFNLESLSKDLGEKLEYWTEFSNPGINVEDVEKEHALRILDFLRFDKIDAVYGKLEEKAKELGVDVKDLSDFKSLDIDLIRFAREFGMRVSDLPSFKSRVPMKIYLYDIQTEMAIILEGLVRPPREAVDLVSLAEKAVREEKPLWRLSEIKELEIDIDAIEELLGISIEKLPQYQKFTKDFQIQPSEIISVKKEFVLKLADKVKVQVTGTDLDEIRSEALEKRIHIRATTDFRKVAAELVTLEEGLGIKTDELTGVRRRLDELIQDLEKEFLLKLSEKLQAKEKGLDLQALKKKAKNEGVNFRELLEFKNAKVDLDRMKAELGEDLRKLPGFKYRMVEEARIPVDDPLYKQFDPAGDLAALKGSKWYDINGERMRNLMPQRGSSRLKMERGVMRLLTDGEHIRRGHYRIKGEEVTQGADLYRFDENFRDRIRVIDEFIRVVLNSGVEELKIEHIKPTLLAAVKELVAAEKELAGGRNKELARERNIEKQKQIMNTYVRKILREEVMRDKNKTQVEAILKDAFERSEQGEDVGGEKAIIEKADKILGLIYARKALKKPKQKKIYSGIVTKRSEEVKEDKLLFSIREMQTALESIKRPDTTVINTSNTYGFQAYAVDFIDTYLSLPESLRAMTMRHEVVHLKYPTFTEDIALKFSPVHLVADAMSLWVGLENYEEADKATHEPLVPLFKKYVREYRLTEEEEKVRSSLISGLGIDIDRVKIIDMPFAVNEKDEFVHSIALEFEGRRVVYLQLDVLKELAKNGENAVDTLIAMQKGEEIDQELAENLSRNILEERRIRLDRAVEKNLEGVRQSVAIIGGGPAGLGAAEALSQAEALAQDGYRVVVFDDHLDPGGYSRRGVYPDKVRMRAGFRRQFLKSLNHPNVQFVGGVRVTKDGEGGDASVDDLKKMGFDVIIVATGALGSKKIHIPGESLGRVYDAKNLVGYYEGDPDYKDLNPQLGETAVIGGNGNVSVDTSHWIIHRRDYLAVDRFMHSLTPEEYRRLIDTLGKDKKLFAFLELLQFYQAPAGRFVRINDLKEVLKSHQLDDYLPALEKAWEGTEIEETKVIYITARRGPLEKAFEPDQMMDLAEYIDIEDLDQEFARLRESGFFQMILENDGMKEYIDKVAAESSEFKDVEITHENVERFVRQTMLYFNNQPNKQKWLGDSFRRKMEEKLGTNVGKAKIRFRFNVSPQKFFPREDGNIQSIVFDVNELHAEEGHVVNKKTGRTFRQKGVTSFIKSIGNTVEDVLGLPMKGGVISTKENQPRGTSDFKSEYFQVYDARKDELYPDVFVVGWANVGSAGGGVVGLQRRHGRVGVQIDPTDESVQISLDAMGGVLTRLRQRVGDGLKQKVEVSLEGFLEKLGKRVVSMDDVVRIDKKMAEKYHKPNTNEEMFAFLDEALAEESNDAAAIDNVVDGIKEVEGSGTASKAAKRGQEDVLDEIKETDAVGIDEQKNPGGIDFNPRLLDLQIKRDSRGIPLPLPQQPIHRIDVDGFLPVIINIIPIPSVPVLLGLQDRRRLDPVVDISMNQLSPAREIEQASINSSSRF